MSFVAAQRRSAVDNDLAVLSGSEEHDDTKPKITRSKSNTENVLDDKEAWGKAIATHETMQSSMQGLLDNLKAYEAKASEQNWSDALLGQAKVTELNELVRKAAEKRRSTGNRAKEWFDNFSLVALEYSRLLDVLMNQCPEYVAAEWGAMKILLLTNVNHTKLKENVESYLIVIGERLGLVNQLICYTATGKMVEAVPQLYATFSEFLAKALKSYTNCRLARVAEALTFPWETKFERLVQRMDLQFRRIRDLSHASHFHATLQQQHVMHSIRDCVREHRNEWRQERVLKRAHNEKKEMMKEHQRKELSEEVNRGISELLGQFQSKILMRFDELVMPQNSDQSATSQSAKVQAVDTFDYAIGESLDVEDYFAASTSSPGKMLHFRDTCFSDLAHFDVSFSSSLLCLMTSKYSTLFATLVI